MSLTSKLKVGVADSSETWFSIYLHGVTFQNTALRTSNLTALLVATLSLCDDCDQIIGSIITENNFITWVIIECAKNWLSSIILELFTVTTVEYESPIISLLVADYQFLLRD
jgi:hypothetical protein